VTLADALKEPTSRLVVLATIRAGQTLEAWTQDATYTNLWWSSTSLEVERMLEDGSDLTTTADLATANGTDGSYYWDRAAGRVYVNPTAANPHQALIQARVVVRVANHPKRWGAERFEPRMAERVGVSIRVPERFGGLGQIGGGRLVIEAGDGWADGIEALDFDAGTVTLELGADVLR